MSDLLIKLFIKNNSENELKTREKYGTLSGITGIVCNIILCVFHYRHCNKFRFRYSRCS